MISIRFPTNIKIKSGILKDIYQYLQELNIHKPLVVTDSNIIELNFFQELLKTLNRNKVMFNIFSETSGNPVKSDVEKGTQTFQENACDGILIIGGGCALDVGKAIALMARHKGDLFEYEDGKKDAKTIVDNIPSILAVPSTAGTGSEVGGSSVISDDKTHKKYIIWSPFLVPKLVIADPMILTGLPAQVTASTGIDALSHNLEAFLVASQHPFADAIATEGISLVHKSLIKSFKEPQNIEARTDMLLASMMGATAFQKGLGVVHSCAHALSTCYNLHHGLAIATTLRAGLKFNLEAVEFKIKKLGRIIAPSQNENNLVNSFFDWLDSLYLELSLPQKLSKLNVKLTDNLIHTAFNDSCHLSNPRKCSKDDFINIFEKSL